MVPAWPTAILDGLFKLLFVPNVKLNILQLAKFIATLAAPTVTLSTLPSWAFAYVELLWVNTTLPAAAKPTFISLIPTAAAPIAFLSTDAAAKNVLLFIAPALICSGLIESSAILSWLIDVSYTHLKLPTNREV